MHRVLAQEMATIYANRNTIDSIRAKMVWAAKEASMTFPCRRKDAAVHVATVIDSSF